MIKKKTMDDRSVRHRIVLPRGERIWRMPRCWSIAVIVVVGLAGCSSREAQWSGFIPVLVVLLSWRCLMNGRSSRCS